MVECAGLENRNAARHRGFESHPLRQCERASPSTLPWDENVVRAEGRRRPETNPATAGPTGRLSRLAQFVNPALSANQDSFHPKTGACKGARRCQNSNLRCSGRGRDAGFPRAPRTDPGERNYRTGLLP